MTIFIDADGCPVVDATIRIAKQRQIPVVIVYDDAHVFQKDYATSLQVSKGSDSVDFALVNALHKGDLVITQDYGLAAMCLAKQAQALNQNGFFYTPDNIDSLLYSRYENQRLRAAGSRVKGPKKRNATQNSAYEKALIDFLREKGLG